MLWQQSLLKDEQLEMKEEQKENKPKLPLFEQNDATIELLLNAGVHFGHHTQRWNPAMRQYIYTAREGIHIIDLIKTVDKLNQAIEALYEYASKGEVLFVGTKTQAKDIVKLAAIRAKSHFVINRWPGGLLTNYMVTRKSIKKLNDYAKAFKEGIENRTKKEMLSMKKELEALNSLYGGVKLFNKKPSCLVVVDPKKSRIAVREAAKMHIPVIAMVDTNASPEMVDHVIPSNDDALGSIDLIINRLADVVLLANKGVGAEYSEVDFAEIEDSIQNMAQKLEEKKKNQKYGTQEENKGHRVVRVTREQAKRFTKAPAKK